MTTAGAPLTLFNSLSRAIEPFQPIDPKMVRLYSCGPTVYSTAHLGNLRAYVFTDTLRRTLLWKGLNVTHVINITDVGHLTSDADAGDDKMEAAARAQAKSIWDIAAHYTQAFKQNIADLNIVPPSEWTVRKVAPVTVAAAAAPATVAGISCSFRSRKTGIPESRIDLTRPGP